MKKWCLGVLMAGVVAMSIGACGGGKDSSQSPCKTGGEACWCYENETCDRGLSCLAGLCLDLNGSGGAPFDNSEGGAAEPAGGSPDEMPQGAKDSGGSAGVNNNAGASLGGSFNFGGSNGAAGKGGSGGTGSTVDKFPPDPAGCALVSTCPTCCETTGVYALDALAKDATSKYVTAFTVSAESALAEFDFLGSGQIGAIFFRFGTAQTINSLSIAGSGTGGSLEVALVRAQGKDGCIYPVVGGSLSPVPDTCWGLGAGPYALLPADQIEIRVRALTAGRAALNITDVQYGP
jgi:hypothetical protein